MKPIAVLGTMVLLAVGCVTSKKAAPVEKPGPAPAAKPEAAKKADDGWVSLYDGKSLDGWKASEHKASFSVVDGKIRAFGPRSHLFYVGPVNNHTFKNFELKLEAMTTAGSNSGVYFHAAYQENGWPKKGIEAQVNATHSDWRKTGSLYGIKDIRQAPHKDNEWFDYHIIVQGRHITLKVNGQTTIEHTEPGPRLSSGTFALQGHDPKSTVFFRNIRVRPLPD